MAALIADAKARIDELEDNSRAAMPVTSRYVDLFSLGLLLNGLCLLRHEQEKAGSGAPEQAAYLPFAQLWMLVVLGGLEVEPELDRVVDVRGLHDRVPVERDGTVSVR